MNFLEGELVQPDGHLSIRLEQLTIPLPETHGAISATGNVLVGVRPEHVRVDSDPNSGGTAARVALVEPVGPVTYLDLVIGELMIKASVDPRMRVQRDQQISVAFDQVYLFDPASGARLDSAN